MGSSIWRRKLSWEPLLGDVFGSWEEICSQYLHSRGWLWIQNQNHPGAGTSFFANLSISMWKILLNNKTESCVPQDQDYADLYKWNKLGRRNQALKHQKHLFYTSTSEMSLINPLMSAWQTQTSSTHAKNRKLPHPLFIYSSAILSYHCQNSLHVNSIHSLDITAISNTKMKNK